MKYKILLKFLNALIYTKRAIWWFLEKAVLRGFLIIFGAIWGVVGLVLYKIKYSWKKSDLRNPRIWFVKRSTLQGVVCLLLLFVIFPQTKLYTKKETSIPGQDALAYRLSTSEQDYETEQALTEQIYIPIEAISWKEGAVINDVVSSLNGDLSAIHEKDLSAIVAGGSAVSKPTIMPGANVGGDVDLPASTTVPKINKIIEYKVQNGDSIGSIARKFDISLLTLLWENNLTSRSVIQPGQVLRILPVSGVAHTVRKGDTVLKIANQYGSKVMDIINANNLNSKGSNLQVGQKIIVPNGVIKTVSVSSPTKKPSSYNNSGHNNDDFETPASSSGKASKSGYLWPSAAKTITQYYSWSHHGLDIAGPFRSANYAAQDGVVEKAQCGWNSGYGCYVVINHGGGIKTLYGHNDKLLVSPGDEVVRGQTIGLMGNTGKVRGITGIHLHFEVQVNGVRVNPLKYIR